MKVFQMLLHIRYSVKPNSGVVGPKAEVAITCQDLIFYMTKMHQNFLVSLQPFEHDMAEKNKFKVQSRFAPDGKIKKGTLVRSRMLSRV